MEIIESFDKGRQKRFLIIRAGAVGDCLLLLPLLQSLRHSYPKAHIALMGYPSRLRLLQVYADAVASVEADSMETFFTDNAPLAPSLVHYFSQFDLILSYRYDPEGLFTQSLRRTGAKEVFPHPPFPAPTEQIHIIDHYLKPLEMLQIPIISRIPFLPLTAEQIRRATTFFYQHPLLKETSLVAVMHPGSGGEQKRWPATHFAALADRLIKREGATILFIPGPADQQVVQEVRAEMQADRVVIAEGLGLEEVAAFLAHATIYIGNDSGLTHLAAAVGALTIAIMGATDPHRWAPRGRHVHLLTLPQLPSAFQSLWEHFPADRVDAAISSLLASRHLKCTTETQRTRREEKIR